MTDKQKTDFVSLLNSATSIWNKCLDEFIFASRWLLYPINIGLMLALGIYLLKYLKDLLDLFSIWSELSDDQLLSALVGLLDKGMIVSLVILIVIGGHQIYVRRLSLKAGRSLPQWLEHIDTMILKVKVSLAFVGVSSVQLLKDFLDREAPKETIETHVELHLVFLLSTLILALVWRIMHPAYPTKE
jgi:uncharacterized protein (TIGR00645 family)